MFRQKPSGVPDGFFCATYFLLAPLPNRADDLIMMLDFEKKLWRKKKKRIAGVDEAGRGPLAGSVVAGAVVFDSAFLKKEQHKALADLNDSKKLSEKRRDYFFDFLMNCPHARCGVGEADAAEIDDINILQATWQAMYRAVEDLPITPDYIFVDGNPVPGFPIECQNIIKGDGRSLSIAAGSIIAKVTRDRQMKQCAEMYPEYGFERHKGYGTKLHLAALQEHGPCPIHRMTFKPVRAAMKK